MLFGYCGRSHGDALLHPQPYLSSSFNLCSWECTARGGDHGTERPVVSHRAPVVPLSLQCSPAPELAVPNHIYCDLVLQHLLLDMESPWQSNKGDHCSSLVRSVRLCCAGSRKELELNLVVMLILDAGAGHTQLLQRNAPLRPAGRLWPGYSRSHPWSCFMDPFDGWNSSCSSTCLQWWPQGLGCNMHWVSTTGQTPVSGFAFPWERNSSLAAVSLLCSLSSFNL